MELCFNPSRTEFLINSRYINPVRTSQETHYVSTTNLQIYSVTVTPCGLVGTSCLHLQDRNLLTKKTEAAGSSETSVNIKTTRRHVLKDRRICFPEYIHFLRYYSEGWDSIVRQSNQVIQSNDPTSDTRYRTYGDYMRRGLDW
jgi:hypothetical protein